MSHKYRPILMPKLKKSWMTALLSSVILEKDKLSPNFHKKALLKLFFLIVFKNMPMDARNSIVGKEIFPEEYITMMNNIGTSFLRS
jgi:hypothetical protein